MSNFQAYVIKPEGIRMFLRTNINIIWYANIVKIMAFFSQICPSVMIA